MPRPFCYHPNADADNAPISLWVGGAQTARLIQLKWPEALVVMRDRSVRMFGAGCPQFFLVARGLRGEQTKGTLFDLRPLTLEQRLDLIVWLDERQALYDADRTDPEVHRAYMAQFAS
jgi:hypothetical protein